MTAKNIEDALLFTAEHPFYMFALLRVMDAGVGGTRKPQHRIAAGWGSRRQIGICLIVKSI